MAAHLCAHGIESYVASAGGAQAEQLVRGAHVDLPQLCSKNPLNVLVVAPPGTSTSFKMCGIEAIFNAVTAAPRPSCSSSDDGRPQVTESVIRSAVDVSFGYWSRRDRLLHI